jgi:hypothetical protein
MIAYIRVPQAEVDSVMARLDALIEITLTTQHYSAPMQPCIEGVTDVLFPVEDSPEVAALVPEYWASKTDVIPPEFRPPLPGGPV